MDPSSLRRLATPPSSSLPRLKKAERMKTAAFSGEAWASAAAAWPSLASRGQHRGAPPRMKTAAFSSEEKKMVDSQMPRITNHTCVRGMRLQCQFSHRLRSVASSMVLNTQPAQRIYRKDCGLLQAASPMQRTENLTQSSISFKDFCVSVCTEEDGMIKIQVNVSGTMTDSIFDKVFTKKVAAAQPLPGFRQMKGGKTPDVPKEVALHLIGPSKVKKETIKKIINCTVAEYVQKEGLTVSKNLKVEQSYEELEAEFEPGKEFCFDATVHLQ